jgi:hypothetical protein
MSRTRRGDDLAVVGELALDQARDEPQAPDVEGHVLLADPNGDRVAARQRPRQLAERTRGHQHVLALGEHARAG